MGNEKHLIPMNKRTKEEQSRIARMGGIASGKARRRKSNIKKALEAILTLDVPDDELQSQLEELGLDPSVENSLVFNVIYRTLQEGDPKSLEIIARIMGQVGSLSDKKEQKARTERIQLEAERLKHGIAAMSGEVETGIEAFRKAMGYDDETE